VRDVERISTTEYGNGFGTLSIMHLRNGQAIVADSGGKAFVDAVNRAALEPIEGWENSNA
jgi:hypothetical protein